MATQIQFHNPDQYRLNEERLKRAAQTVLEQCAAYPRAGMTIVITSQDNLRELNQRHRLIDAPTDVLSFAAPSLPDEISEEQTYLGDVIIACEYAAAQAAAKGAPLEETLCLLVIHGTLHLLGYTHDAPEACERMWEAQAKALESLGINRALVDRYETVKRA